MKKWILITILFCIACNNSVYCQERNYHSIQQVLSHHIEQLKTNIGHYDNIFIITNLEDSLILPKNVLRVESRIDAKFLNKKNRDFLVEARIATQLNYLKIDITNYRIVKLSNKKIKLLNLNNGQTYIIK
jgi:hypothetical protein